MTADINVFRLGKLCNTPEVVALHRSIERELRGRTYQAEQRVQRLRCAWPDEDARTPTQQAAIQRAALYAVSCRAALTHEQEVLALLGVTP
jgi:hypothetical protein